MPLVLQQTFGNDVWRPDGANIAIRSTCIKIIDHGYQLVLYGIFKSYSSDPDMSPTHACHRTQAGAPHVQLFDQCLERSMEQVAWNKYQMEQMTGVLGGMVL